MVPPAVPQRGGYAIGRNRDGTLILNRQRHPFYESVSSDGVNLY